MKNTVSQVRPRIVSYSELDAPLSIDPVLDGGLKLDILDCLNNKANSVPYLKLASEPSPTTPATELGSNGEYYVLLSTPNLVFVKSSGSWNAVEKVNTMFFYVDTIDGIRKYYAFDDALENAILVHSIDFGNPGGELVKYTPQTLTTPQKTQARLNIDAASQAYIDNAIAALKNSGAIGASVAGSIMPWFGTEASIPQDWAKINAAQTWYSKTEYAQLYQALGSENNPFGLTSTTFSIPFFPSGTSIVQAGGTFVRGTNGGEQEVTLTKAQIPSTNSNVPGITGGDNSDNNNTAKFAGGDKPNGQGTEFNIVVASDGGGGSHNNMSPYSPAMWIIKLKNTGTTITADQLQIINTVPLVCSDEKTDLTASTDVPVIRFVFQTAQSFTKIVGELNTAAAGGTFTVVAKKNGVSFLSTPLTFDGGENTTRTASVPFVFTTPTVSFSVGDYVEIFITAIGAVTPGKGLKIYLM